MDIFTQSRRAGELEPPDPGSPAESWGLLENAVLAFDGLDQRRISRTGRPTHPVRDRQERVEGVVGT
jgi:hypothetical protein